MTETSARFALPFIQPGQAQKEVFHNEALAQIDALLHAAVEDARANPPQDPRPGQCWLVAAVAAGGAWAGAENRLAAWTSGGWRFYEPVIGAAVWDIASGVRRSWLGNNWSDGEVAAARLMVAGQQVVGPRLPAVPSPSGGTIIDQEARAALQAVIATLMSHGLIE